MALSQFPWEVHVCKNSIAVYGATEGGCHEEVARLQGFNRFDNARLIIVACNSYATHGGNSVLESGDLLNEALSLIRELLPHATNDIRRLQTDMVGNLYPSILEGLINRAKKITGAQGG